MLDSLIDLMTSPIFLIFYVGAPVVIVLIHHRRVRAMKAMLWLVEEGQYMLVEESEIDALLNFAQKRGDHARALKLLMMVRQQYGHKGVKAGHIAWILEALDEGTHPEDVESVPAFVKGKKD